MFDPIRVDPQLQPILSKLPDLDFADVAACRSRFNAFRAGILKGQEEGVTTRTHSVAGLRPDDPPVAFQIVTPHVVSGRASLLWIHGGGFILGSAENDNAYVSGLARRLGITVASVNYRLSPETVYPGALNDSEAVLMHLQRDAGTLDIDAERIGIAGRSHERQRSFDPDLMKAARWGTCRRARSDATVRYPVV